jgi:uncharacterized protein YjbJ (UPF0337 family)
MWNEDEIKGKGKQIVGKIKENLGNAADDRKAEAEGKRERVEGEIQESYGKALRNGEEAVDDLQD